MAPCALALVPRVTLMMPSIFVHIVTWNSPASLSRCIESVLAQSCFRPGESMNIRITDNNSTNGVLENIERQFGNQIEVRRNKSNLGFCGANNQAVRAFLDGCWDYFFILNPDVRLESEALQHLVTAIEKNGAGSACPLLYRADSNLNAIEPKCLDAAGMYITPSLRHFDRGSGQPDAAEYHKDCFVFGGSGAALLMKRGFVEDLLLDGGWLELDKLKLHPELKEGLNDRAPLFDEAFFAYREDADLAWRAQLLGWKCIYAASAVGWHERVVVPERRGELNWYLNLLGVRNRFLLQLNNYSLKDVPQAFLPGILTRNLLVLAGVLLREWTSLPALRQVYQCARRALKRRSALISKSRTRACRHGSWPRCGRWFQSEPYVEELTSNEP